MKWISTKEKLPDPVSTVLIWTNISTEPTLGYYANDWLFFSNNGNFWLKDEDHIEVQYWMELPKPPKSVTMYFPRYFLDIRGGCAAVRDRWHEDYDEDYPGLHSDTPDVVKYIHGFVDSSGWNMKQSDIDSLKEI
jgi:hypothetical protein